MNDPRSDMLKVNEAQRHYYEHASGGSEADVNSTATNFYRRFRRRLLSGVVSLRLAESTGDLHKKWVGDVRQLKVLDLGVGLGNPLSLWFAKHAREYVAIDLSRTRIAAFQARLQDAGIVGVRVEAVDFLSDALPDRDFDLIYAMSVLHHFKHVGTMASAMARCLVPGGRVLSYDPLQTWLPARLFRAMYRTFQTDRAWEFPFTHRTLRTLGERFEFVQVQGLLGKSKWAAFLGLLRPHTANRLASRWHNDDLRLATSVAAVGDCLHVTMLMRKRGPLSGPGTPPDDQV
jgi:2-polyprenyl-3-methyl-5-hydroxy-6-metoxy-1,4-benzoquinol methylase